MTFFLYLISPFRACFGDATYEIAVVLVEEVFSGGCTVYESETLGAPDYDCC